MTPQDAASHLGLFCLHREISSKNEITKIKITHNTPKIESGLIRLIMMGESIRQIWVKQTSLWTTYGLFPSLYYNLTPILFSASMAFTAFYKERKTTQYVITTTFMETAFEPVHEKTNNLGFRPGPTQNGLNSNRRRLEA